MTSDDGLLMWQRLALERGEPIDVPPSRRCRNVSGAAADAATAPLKPAQESGNEQHPGSYRIDLPWQRPPLNHNQRHTPWAKGRLVADVRAAVLTLAKAAKIPHQDFITVQLHYATGHHVRTDPSNWMATTKPAIDALVDAGIVDDDDTEHVHENTPEIHRPPEPGPRCWLTITTTQEGA